MRQERGEEETEGEPTDTGPTLGEEVEAAGGGQAGPGESTASMSGGPSTDGGPEGRGAFRGTDRDELLGGRFALIHRLADQGNLGEVWAAQDTELNRLVVVKLIGGKIARDPAAQNRFLREAEITSGLEHPGVAPVFGYGVTPGGRLWYAMRYVDGQTLARAIREFHLAHPADRPLAAAGDLALRGMLRRFLTVCGTIGYAHDRKVIHRDIKPGNIMFGTGEGDTVVLDWGLGKPLEQPPGSGDGGPAEEEGPGSSGAESPVGRLSGSEPTEPGARVGTLRYMSPQQAQGDPAGIESDIYSLGATLYHLVTGLTPYHECEGAEVRERAQLGEFRRPREVRPRLDRELGAIVEKAMRYDPCERYRSAAALAEDLERWLADEPVSAGRGSWPTRARRWARRRRTAVAAGLVLVLALAGASVPLAVLYGRSVRTERDTRALLAEFLNVMVDDLPGLPGNEGPLRRLSLESLKRLDRFDGMDTGDRDLAARVRASAARVVVRHERADVPESEEVLPGPEVLFGRAIEDLAGLVAEGGEGAADTAVAMARLEVERAAWWSSVLPLDQAMGRCEEALTRVEELAGRFPAASFLGPRGRGLVLRAGLLELAGEREQAAEAAGEAERLLEGSADPGDLAARVAALQVLGRLTSEAGDAAGAIDRFLEARGLAADWEEEAPRDLFARAAQASARLEALEIWFREPGAMPEGWGADHLEAEARKIGLILQDLRNDFPETVAFERLAAGYALVYARYLGDSFAGVGATQPDDVLRLYADGAMARLDGPSPNLADHRLVVRLLALLRARHLREGDQEGAAQCASEARKRIAAARKSDPARYRDLEAVFSSESRALPPASGAR